MSILVTGATGGFARFFIPKLEEHFSEEIVATGRAESAGFATYVRCDLADPAEVRRLVISLRPSLIFHLAGSFSGDFNTDLAINALSSKLIFESLLFERIPARTVLIGSAAEYGMISPVSNPITESQPLNPVSVYGITKAIQTQLAKYYAAAHNVDTVIARLFNLIGPGLSERLFVGRVEMLINKYKLGEIGHLELGNLNSLRDYIDFDDAFDQILLIAERGKTGEVYNVGSGKATSMRDLLYKLISNANVPGETVVEAGTANTGPSRIDVPVIFADLTKTLSLNT